MMISTTCCNTKKPRILSQSV